jgi:ectoine hydroxylase-related dioxygenase (phytanoyl-CoA dioxygenase family)
MGVVVSHPVLPRLSTPYLVPRDAVAAYQRDGHVRLPAVATRDEAAAFRSVIRHATLRLSQERRPLAERDTYGRAFLQVGNLWRADEGAAEFVLARRFAGVAAQLLGVRRVRIYHDQALFKEAGGGHTPWHQDALYWPLVGQRCITMWMPLVDVADDMGGMAFASGTNAVGPLSDEAISDASDVDFQRVLAAGGYPIAMPVPMSAGDATFHGGWTVHEALPNESQTMREVMTVIYFADGERVLEPKNDEQRHDLASWLPGLSPGELAASELNPVVEP